MQFVKISVCISGNVESSFDRPVLNRFVFLNFFTASRSVVHGTSTKILKFHYEIMKNEFIVTQRKIGIENVLTNVMFVTRVEGAT